MSTAVVPAPGFADPVGDAQRIFRATLNALSRPTLPQRVSAGVLPPAPLGPMVGAVALTLCDEETPIWLDTSLRFGGVVEAWLRFHTGAPLTAQLDQALFCIVSSPSEIPPLGGLAQGTDEDPHRSVTVIVDATDAKPCGDFLATGPGIDGAAGWDGAGLPPTRSAGFLTEWATNADTFPRGVDVLLAGDGVIRALARTTRLTEVK